jgi:hypothetical protein
MTKYVAFEVDPSGTALARYDLAATDVDAATLEARQYVECHRVLEIWSVGGGGQWQAASAANLGEPNASTATRQIDGHPPRWPRRVFLIRPPFR